jgi:hypothetical protein
MAIKTKLKYWATVLDEALLGSESLYNEAGQNTPSGVALPGFSPPVPQHAEGASTLSNIVVDMQALRSFTTMQIPAPQALEPELLSPFERGEKAVLLLFPARDKTIAARLHAIHTTHLLVDTDHSTIWHKPGEGLLVVFPIFQDRRYILQATIEEVYAGRFKLGYLDPRYDVRRHIRLAEPVLFRVLSPAIVSAIEQHQIRLVRHIKAPTFLAFPPQGGSINDCLYTLEATSLAPCTQLLDTIPSFPGDLRDISRGGMCLALESMPAPASLLQQLLLLRIVLPAGASAPGRTEEKSAVLTLLGVVRGVKIAVAPDLLHIRFLQRLPDVYDTIFTALELLTRPR